MRAMSLIKPASRPCAVLLCLALAAYAARAQELTPAPPAQEQVPGLVKPPPSSITVPLSIPLEAIRSAAEAEVPPSWAEWDAWIRPHRACVRYKVERRSLVLGGTGNRVDLSIPGHFWFRGCYSFNNRACAPCGSCDADFNAPMHANLQFHPDWRLDVSGVNDGIRVNDCRVMVISYNINGRIADATNPHIDRVLARAVERLRERLNFKPQGEMLWKQANEALKVRDGLWLQLNPKSLRASQPQVDGAFVRTTLGMVAEPVLVASVSPPAVGETPPLPPLDLVEPTEGFQVSLEARLDLGEASRLLDTRLAGRRYPFLGNKRWVKIKQASVYGTGQSLVLRLEVGEGIEGTLYLVGTPRYDTSQDVLWVEGLDYSIETKEAALNEADWLLHGKWQESLAQEARWSLGENLRAARDDVQAALNKQYGNLVLSGSLTDLRAVGIASTATQCIVHAAAQGSVRATYVP